MIVESPRTHTATIPDVSPLAPRAATRPVTHPAQSAAEVEVPVPIAPARGDFVERRAGPDRRRSTRAYRSVDLTVALATLALVLVATSSEAMPRHVGNLLAMRVTVKNVALLAVCSIVWVASFTTMGTYDRRARHARREKVLRTVIACTLGSSGVLLFPLATSGRGAFTYGMTVVYWVTVTFMMLALRLCTGVMNRAARRRIARRVIIVGAGPRADELARRLAADSEISYHLLGFVDTRVAAGRYPSREWNLGFLDELEQTLMRTVVDEVLIALPIRSHYAEIESTIGICERAGVHSKYLADVFQPSRARARVESSGSCVLMAMQIACEDYRVHVKRTLDVLTVALSLPVMLPVVACIALAIRMTSDGPIFFTQERYGYRKRWFRMYKFRTMVVNAESMQSALERSNGAVGPVFKIAQDPRITPLGRLLRRASLDELPQLFNVLRGDMSLVGPRPMPTWEVGRFSDPSLMRRFSVRPGLTGLWQVSGRSYLSFEQRMALDLRYVDDWSLSLDLTVLARTLPAVVKGTGAM